MKLVPKREFGSPLRRNPTVSNWDDNPSGPLRKTAK